MTGLFYSGIIIDESSSFSFVYDCGTFYVKDKPTLMREIDCLDISESASNKGVINALFLSHLDNDHISGVPHLLEKYTVENIFMPYLTPGELILLAANTPVPDAHELIKLYDDPIGYFSEHGCENIFFLHSERPQDKDTPLSSNGERISETELFFFKEMLRSGQIATMVL